MPPRFSLQTVLDYRHNRVEKLEQELSILLREEMESRRTLEMLLSTQFHLNDRLTQCLQDEVDLVNVRHLQMELKAIEGRIRRQRKSLESLGNQIAAKRNELIKAKQDEETLVILKDKEIERFLAMESRKELRLQDDIYNAKAYRRIHERKIEQSDPTV